MRNQHIIESIRQTNVIKLFVIKLFQQILPD